MSDVCSVVLLIFRILKFRRSMMISKLQVAAYGGGPGAMHGGMFNVVKYPLVNIQKTMENHHF